jgi:hypothetical protein
MSFYSSTYNIQIGWGRSLLNSYLSSSVFRHFSFRLRLRGPEHMKGRLRLAVSVDLEFDKCKGGVDVCKVENRSTGPFGS